MPEHPEPTTNIGKLIGQILQYEAEVQRFIDCLDRAKKLPVGVTEKQPVLKGIHMHGHVYDWDLGTLTRRS